MGSGWIKADRDLLNEEFYPKDSEKVHLWLHLHLKANHKERKEMLGNETYVCQPGEFTTGRKQLSLETGISEGKIERVLKYFEKTLQLIEQHTTKRNRLITILNWDLTQFSEQQNVQQSNSNRTTNEHTIRTNKQKEKKEGYTCLSDLIDSGNFNPEYLDITEAFIELIKKNIEELAGNSNILENPEAACYYDIYEIIETDKFNKTQLKIVFHFLQVDDFWKKIILDTQKLRKHFQTILIKAQSNGTTKKSFTREKRDLTATISDYWEL